MNESLSKKLIFVGGVHEPRTTLITQRLDLAVTAAINQFYWISKPSSTNIDSKSKSTHSTLRPSIVFAAIEKKPTLHKRIKTDNVAAIALFAAYFFCAVV